MEGDNVMKFGDLLLKTICKPIANRLRKEAGLHPKFRRFIVNVAQTQHRVSSNLKRHIFGETSNVQYQPLEEEKAVQTAADFNGEFLIFSVAGAALMLEVQRSKRLEAIKKEKEKQKFEEIMRTLKQYVDDQMKQQRQTVKEDLEDLIKQQSQTMKIELEDLMKQQMQKTDTSS